MDIKCSDCRKSITDPIDKRWQAWTRLMNWIDIQNLQGEISDALWEALTDDIMWLKPDTEDGGNKDESE